MARRNDLAQEIREGFLEEAMLEANNSKIDDESIQEKGLVVQRKIMDNIALKQGSYKKL